MIDQIDTAFDILGYYRAIAGLSKTFEDYRSNAANGIALLCMGMGKALDGVGYINFIKAWNEKVKESVKL